MYIHVCYRYYRLILKTWNPIFFMPVSRLTIWLSGRSPGLPPKVPPEAPGDLSRFRRQAKSRVSGRRRVDRLICDSQRETKKTIWIIWIILYIYMENTHGETRSENDFARFSISIYWLCLIYAYSITEDLEEAVSQYFLGQILLNPSCLSVKSLLLVISVWVKIGYPISCR